jgi:hypothetical protein
LSQRVIIGRAVVLALLAIIPTRKKAMIKVHGVANIRSTIAIAVATLASNQRPSRLAVDRASKISRGPLTS